MMETISPSTSSIGSSNNDDVIRSRNSSPSPSSEGERIDVPMENDVLCGRGGSINSHKGNEQFRTLVEKRRRVYLTARFKREKRLIASSIVSEIRGMNPPGRFLARKGSKDNGYWYDIGDEKARDKTSQALRENAPSIRAEIETEINKQREEMRRQEESSLKQAHQLAAAAASSQQQRPPPGPYPHGALPQPPGAPVPPGGQHHQQSYQSYAQQYYDYYYHYYGYSAPPPPPPPGYPGGPPPPPGYTPTPPVYWAAQQQQKNSGEGEEFKEGIEPQEQEANKNIPPPPAAAAAAMPQQQQQQQNAQFPPMSQEEADHRIAMALQQEENAKAFEDRNRRFGSDRRSSRSAAFCAPGYRPRLLNDHALDEYGQSKKRPSMSASHYVGNSVGSFRKKAGLAFIGTPTHSDISGAASQLSEQHKPTSQEEMDHRMAAALQEEEDKALRNQLAGQENAARRTSRSNAHSQVQRANHGFGLESMVSSSLMAWTRGVSSTSASGKDSKNTNNSTNLDNGTGTTDTDMHHDEGLSMDLKPAADDNLFMKQLDRIDHHHHNHDHSLGSLSSRGRGVHFKDDSDIISLFGEGGTIIPPPSSTGGSLRVRDSSGNNFNPISLDDSQNSRLSQFQKRGGSSRQVAASQRGLSNERQLATPQRRMSNENDSSLLSQVANHILGTFGSSWAEHDGGTPGRLQKSASRRSSISSRDNVQIGSEMETEMGQEVIMDMRDESNMPPPYPRGAGQQVDWPSRAGCHSWIPESIGANASAFFGNNNEDHDNRLSHSHDHSLLRQNSYSRADISPVNSLDMDMSSSLLGNRQRGGRNISLMNVFDHKPEDPCPEELSPHIHQSVVQQMPSWDRSYRSRSPTISLADIDDEDDSLIRVSSYDVKDKLLSMMPPGGNDMHIQQQHHNMPPPIPVHHSHHQHHHHHHNDTKEPHENGLDSSDDMDMGMDWEGE